MEVDGNATRARAVIAIGALIAALPSLPVRAAEGEPPSAGSVRASASPVSTAPPANGRFHPLAPTRIVDTRSGLGGHRGALSPDSGLAVSVNGRAGVPADRVTAVAINLTATNTTEAGFLTAYPDGVARPGASNVNFAREQSVANLAVVGVGTTGRIVVYNSAGMTDVVIDVVGWFDDFYDLTVNDGAYLSGVTPSRVLDTRVGNGVRLGALGPEQEVEVRVRGRGGVPDRAQVTGVVLNLTATEPTAAGYLTLYPAGSARPIASTVNFQPEQVIANLVFAKLSAAGTVTVYNYAGSTQVVADVVGYFATDLSDSSGQLFSVTPTRIADTRTGLGVTQGALGPDSELVIPINANGGLPTGGVSSVVLNVTATETTTNGFVTVFPSSSTRPNASTVNFPPGTSVPNLAVVKVGSDGAVRAYNFSGLTHVVVDVVGWYSDAKAIPPAVAGAGASQNPPANVKSTFLRAKAPVPAADVAKRWTAERLAKAAPVAIGDRGGNTVRTQDVNPALSDDRQLTHPTYGGGFLPNDRLPRPAGPTSPIGRLYLDPSGSGTFTGACSATVIDTDVILTAAHCVYDARTGFFADFAFVPNQFGPVNLADPASVWGYTDVLVNSRYVQVSNPINAGQPFWPFDYAMVKLGPKTINGRSTSIAELTGTLRLGTQSTGGIKLTVGYSSEGPEFDPYCPRNVTNECYPFFTLSPVSDYVRYPRAQTGLDRDFHEVGFGSFLPNQVPRGPAGGMSGGPVLERIGNQWRVTSVVSNGPSVLDRDGTRLYARNLWGPYLEVSADEMLGVINA